MRKLGHLALLSAFLVLVIVAVAACGDSASTTTSSPGEATGTAATTPTTQAVSSSTLAAGDKVELKVISAWAETNVMNTGFKILQKKVQEKSGGSVELKWGGGPEAIPSAQLAEALRSGVVDMAWTAHTYSVAQIPVLEAAKFTKLLPWDERAAGVADFYDKLYQEKMNAHYLGAGTPGLTYNLYTTVPIATMADFKGKSIRVTPAYKAFAAALGAAPVTTDPGEVYSALERNMVLGYGWPSVGISDFGWDEVTKYVIDPAFYSVDVCALVNSKAWAKLSADQQKAVTEAMIETEREEYDYFKKAITDDRTKITAKGVKAVTLPEAEQYLKLAYDSGWAAVMAKDQALATELKSKIDK